MLARMIVSLLLLIIGMLYAGFPYAIQLIPILPSLGFEELLLQFLGVVLLIIGLIVALMH